MEVYDDDLHEGVRLYLEYRAGLPPFVASRSEMAAEVEAVFSCCARLDADRSAQKLETKDG